MINLILYEVRLIFPTLVGLVYLPHIRPTFLRAPHEADNGSLLFIGSYWFNENTLSISPSKVAI